MPSFNYAFAHCNGGKSNKELCKDFVTRNGFRECKFVHNGEMNFVETLRNNRVIRTSGFHKDEYNVPHLDHADLFYGKKRKVLVFHPYVNDEQAKQIKEWADKYGLEMRESGTSYYYPGTSRMFIIATRDNFPVYLNNDNVWEDITVESSNEMSIEEMARLARNEYFRKRRKTNPEKYKEVQNRYWANRYLKEHGCVKGDQNGTV